jgi:biotin carboxyl carrier protein
MKRELLLNGKCLEFSVDAKGDTASVKLNGCELSIQIREAAAGRLLMNGEDRACRARVVRDKDWIHVWIDGRTFEFQIPSADGEGAAGEELSKDEVHAPMPGTMIMLSVSVGDEVSEGQTVAVVEAMKMEHNLRAPRAGKVAKITAQVGQIVDTETALVVLEEKPEN